MRKRRKNYTPAEKVAMLRRQLIDKVPVSELCDELQLQPTQFYSWQKLFFENGSAAFDRKSPPADSAHLRTIAFLRENPTQERGRSRTHGGARPAKKSLGGL